MYKIEYGKNKNYEYKKINNFKEPSKKELMVFIECMYATITECMLHSRTLPIPNKVFDICKDWKNGVDNSNITSELIRHYQNPKFHKIPEDHVKKMEEFREKYNNGKLQSF